MAALSLKLGKLDAICAKLKCGLSSSKVNDSNGVCGNNGINDGISIGSNTGIKSAINSSNSIEEQSVPVCALDSAAKKQAMMKSAFVEVQEKKLGEGASEISSGGSPESNNNNKKLADYNKSFETTVCHTSDLNPLTGSGRKKSRKSSTPRSIPFSKAFSSSEFCDEKDDLSEYEINNQSRDLSSRASSDRELEEMEEFLDDNSASFASSGVTSPNDFDRSSNCEFDETPDLEDGNVHRPSESKSRSPLDLSIGRNDDDSRESLSTDFSDRDMAPPYKNTFDSTADQSIHSTAAKDQSLQPVLVASGNSPDATEVRVLQDYANNTMNELLSIYGFSGPPEPLTKQIPLENFSKYQKAAQSLAQSLEGNMKAGDPGMPTKSHLLPNGFSQRSAKGLYSSLSATAKLAHLNGGPKHLNRNAGGEFSKFKLSHIRGLKSPVSGSFVKSVTSPGRKLSQAKQIAGYPDYTKYLKRYSNEDDCANPHCKDLGYRDHYHCLDCSFKVFVKKEEMVRHFKWHKKREDSLQHGFLRFSPMDDCSKKYNRCTHNGRQTHYHCIQNGCDKVYISTSDVQMHANYHRKDSAIIQEGFQRFRATEDCGTTSCSFYGQRTTHFHCRRATCNFTFKNKADMEKHKSYHQKDEVLSRDGFKKFMKYEHCSFTNCRYSKISNHIHCIRSGCNYVLHSTAQLYSHKRRHERRDFENAYRNFRQVQRQSHQTPNRQAVPPQGFTSLQTKPASIQPNPLLSTLPVLSPGTQTSIPMGQQSIPSMSLPLTIKTEAGKTIAVQNVVHTEMDGKQVLVPGTDVKSPSIMVPVTSLSGSSIAYGNAVIPISGISPSASVSGILSSPSKSLGDISPVSVPVGGISPVSASVSGISQLSTPSSCISPLAAPTSGVNLSSAPVGGTPQSSAPANEVPVKREVQSPPVSKAPPGSISAEPSLLSNYGDVVKGENLGDSLTLPIPTYSQPTSASMVVTPASPAPSALMSATQSSSASLNIMQQQRVAENWRIPREKDEAWKSYLIRYTANDPCNSRCQYLYKDHYHCKVDGCVVLFRSKDGVREHAKFHEIQDRITPLVYIKFEADEACQHSCQFSLQEKHYHCNWTGCSHEIPASGPAFARLEHYRIHEYAKASIGKVRYGSNKQESDIEKRRRGRPPKFPKGEIPRIPKVELPNDVIAESVRLFIEGKFNQDSDVINGFQRFRAGTSCPDDQCLFYKKEHFHCARARCHHATDRLDVLNLHAKDFHNFVNILEGFEFFDRNIDCRRVHCHNNRANRHFHCLKPKCDYSFVRHSTMAQHDKKHRYGSASASVLSASQKVPSLLYQKEMAAFIPIVPTQTSIATNDPNSKTVIKPAGTFYPVSPSSKRQKNSGPPTVPHINPALTQLVSQVVSTAIVNAGSTTIIQQPMISQMMLPMLPMQMVPPNTIPLASLLKQKGPNALPQPNWASLKNRMHFAIDSNCGRPFCKLKKRDHYHCLECNQAFSDPIRLRMHVGKHGISFERLDPGMRGMKPQAIAPKPSHVPVAVPTTECGLDLSSNSQTGAGTDVIDAVPENVSCEDVSVNNQDDKTRGAIVNLRIADSKIELSEGVENNSGSDFELHMGTVDSDNDADELGCLEIDESFEEPKSSDHDNSFEGLTSPDESSTTDVFASLNSRRSGRKRTHTRHDDFIDSDSALVKPRRLSSPRRAGDKDESVPDGYQRYWYNEDCRQSHCAYRQSVTHFHCSRPDCGYGFSDRSRMVQHTLRHSRLNTIMGDEFQQFRVTVPCGRADCELAGKSSHFHCLRCPFLCADSSKVMAHRKYHVKLDNISSHGFQKYTGTENCGVEACTYHKKQTHYHCTFPGCHHAVLGPAQFAPHKIKHSEEELN
ncbi:zinc finger protein castor homolog 1-like [Gigantopelta aegis]|uniref:zinc finger protein castor homolog 1-like n=1 Tax=Gigantopelta aegis TaxID=1735272 RepID=UPI001B8877B1|nr:zinc finger protein castor homolog 1-like [Gigantopelta aegis]